MDQADVRMSGPNSDDLYDCCSWGGALLCIVTPTQVPAACLPIGMGAMPFVWLMMKRNKRMSSSASNCRKHSNCLAAHCAQGIRWQVVSDWSLQVK
jgi:hypothetical protein